MTIIAAAVATVAIGFEAYSVAVLALSIGYQSSKARKLKAEAETRKAQAAREADLRKGFQLVIDGEVSSIPIVYGRAKVGGNRVLRKVADSYLHAAAAAGGEEFLSSGDSRFEPIQYMSRAVSGCVITSHPDKPLGILGAAIWEVTGNQTVINIGGSSFISRATVTGDLTLDLSNSPDNANTLHDLFMPIYQSVRQAGEKVTLVHPPLNTDGYYDIGDATSFVYEVLGFDPLTKLATLKNPSTNSTVRSTQNPSLASNDSGSKKEFLFVNQDICFGGIHKIYAVDLDNKDFRDSSFGESARIHAYKDGNIADPMITANFAAQAASKFPISAHASMVFKLNRDEPQYNGIPQAQFYVEGLEVKTIEYSGGNYTLSTTKTYTNNFAYIVLDFLLDNVIGQGLDEAEINLESFYKSSLICGHIIKSDVPVKGTIWEEKYRADNSSNYLLRYEANIILDPAEKVEVNRGKLLSVVPEAELIWSSGKYKLVVDHPYVYSAADSYSTDDKVQHGTLFYISQTDNNIGNTPGASGEWLLDPELTEITDADLILDQDGILQQRPSISDRFNHCSVRFINESLNFKDDVVSWPLKSSATYTTYLAEDSGMQLDTETFAEGVTSYNHAISLAEQIVRTSRDIVPYSLEVSRKYANLEVGDYLRLNSQFMQVNGELLRITSTDVTENGNIELQTTKFDANTLALNTDDEVVPVRNIYDNAIAQATNLVISQTGINLALSAGTLTWVGAPDNRVTEYDILITNGPKEISSETSEWRFIGKSINNEFTLPFLAVGVYTFAIVASASRGRAPVLDMASGSQWPKVTLTVADTLLGRSSETLTLFKFAISTPTVPETDDYNFDTGILGGTYNDVGWFKDLNDAREAANDIGNIYFSSAYTVVNPPVTVATPSWSAPQLYGAMINTRALYVFHRQALGAAAPALPLTTTGSYSFADGVLTLPTGNVAWSTSVPAGVGDVWQMETTATITGNYGSDELLVWSTPVVIISAGKQETVLELYKWSVATPSKPGGSSSYNWATLAHDTANIAGSWSESFPSNPQGGATLWIARLKASAVAGTTSTTLSWGASVLLNSDGHDVIGGVARKLAVYQWAASAPSAPTSGTYNWGTSTLTPPAGWEETPQSPTATLILYKVEAELYEKVDSTATALSIAWGPVLKIGQAGTDGLPGLDGTNGLDGDTGAEGTGAIRAYAKTTEQTPINTTIVKFGKNPPTENAAKHWFASETYNIWYATTDALFAAEDLLASGEYLMQTDGIYDGDTATTTWATPYLSSLKVGSISALVGDIDNLDVDKRLALGENGKIQSYQIGDAPTYDVTYKDYGSSIAGIFIGAGGVDPGGDVLYKFDIGDGTDYLRWDGAGLSLAAKSFDLKSTGANSYLRIKDNKIQVYQDVNGVAVERVRIGDLS